MEQQRIVFSTLQSLSCRFTLSFKGAAGDAFEQQCSRALAAKSIGAARLSYVILAVLIVVYTISVRYASACVSVEGVMVLLCLQ